MLMRLRLGGLGQINWGRFLIDDYGPPPYVSSSGLRFDSVFIKNFMKAKKNILFFFGVGFGIWFVSWWGSRRNQRKPLVFAWVSPRKP